MAKCLLIVESPAKAKTINKYLGKDFIVLASYGHVRDLVRQNGAVDPDHDFQMKYEIVERNARQVEQLCREAKKADIIYLATDPDREGEAISWHITEIFKDRGLLDGKQVHRVTFSEITEKAVNAAVANPRQLLVNLIDAQQARRALDYLVGFTLSPVLWRKVHKGLSAGRVQSPALRMIVEREEEIEKFQPKEYWTIDAALGHIQGEFTAKLTQLHGKRFEQFDLTNADDAMDARAELVSAADGNLTVTDTASKERRRRPTAPFTTSTLQQEAARKLGFSTTRTMKTAQQLYEGVSMGGEQLGLITYMRTDATALSEDAVDEIRAVIRSSYGADQVPAQPNIYRTKSKNAQEAHEAIRPTSAKRHPKEVQKFLDGDQYRLYELIWKRTVACQMIEAVLNTVSIDFALPNAKGGSACFRASGSTVVVPGFLRVYEEGKDTKADDDEGRRLPRMNVGDVIPLTDIVTEQHFTEPPPRYNEATIVKSMEEYGIGRPSTYASIIQVLLNREYVVLDGKKFMPTDMGRAVGHFLTEHFTKYVDYDFTAKLEDDLDAVSRGETKWLPLMESFWTPFKALVKEKNDTVDRGQAQGARVLGKDPATGKDVQARLGKYGPMVSIGTKDDAEKPRFAQLKAGQNIHSITLEEALDLFRLPRTVGEFEGNPVIANHGRFGPYVKSGETVASLEQGEDPLDITLEAAIAKIKEKRERIANRVIHDFGGGLQVLNGKFGPYITDGKTNAHVPKGREPKDLTKEECEKAIAEAPPRKGGGRFKRGKFKGKGSGGKKDDLPM